MYTPPSLLSDNLTRANRTPRCRRRQQKSEHDTAIRENASAEVNEHERPEELTVVLYSPQIFRSRFFALVNRTDPKSPEASLPGWTP
jgi:hypothetical protein